MENISSAIAVLIPAYNPGASFPVVVGALRAVANGPLVVVDDGSSGEHRQYIQEVAAMAGVTILVHVINMGKGAALKTGLNHLFSAFPECAGVVTVDADGQHRVEDVVAVCRVFHDNPRALLLGTRAFSGEVPLRSRFGNALTRCAIKLFFRLDISDTQTGLRVVPRELIPRLLTIPANRYEFEMEMLLSARKSGVAVRQHPIATVYFDNNRGSHFNPLVDSFKIYFVLLRFMMSSLLTAGVDITVFMAIFNAVPNVLMATFLARSAALLVNFGLNKTFVFHSKKRTSLVLAQFVALVAVFGLVSASLIQFLRATLGINIIVAKVLAELALYLANFAIQRDFIFGVEERNSTDWDRYYERPYRTAGITRRLVTRRLVQRIERYVPRGAVIAELGGGNSCFYTLIRERVAFSHYHIIDSSRLGLDKFVEKHGSPDGVSLHELDIMTMPASIPADLVFSVGLIEHFTGTGLNEAIAAHFRLLRSGGTAIISFPTPTFLYRITRLLAEFFGVWIFHDEVPVRYPTVESEFRRYGGVLEHSVIWPIFLTQCMVVVRKA